jgi:hypothetical protein
LKVDKRPRWRQQFLLYQHRVENRRQKSEGFVTGHYKAEMMNIGTACKLRRGEEAFWVVMKTTLLGVEYPTIKTSSPTG